MSHIPLPSTVRFHLFRAGRPVPKWIWDISPKDSPNLAAWQFANKNGAIKFTRTCMVIAVEGKHPILLPVANNAYPSDITDTSVIKVNGLHDVFVGGVCGATGLHFITDLAEADTVLQSYLYPSVPHTAPLTVCEPEHISKFKEYVNAGAVE